MTYKVGDKVTIRHDLKKETFYESENGVEFYVNEQMEKEKGKKAIIYTVRDEDGYLIKIEGKINLFSWSDDMFEEKTVNYWEELSCAKLTDEEGRLYQKHLHPELVARHANFSKTFWLEGVIPFQNEFLELNSNLTIEEVKEVYTKNACEVSWQNISRNRLLTTEDIKNYPDIRTNEIFWKNKETKKMFTDETWKEIDELTRKRYEEGLFPIIERITLIRYRMPEDILEKEWDKLSYGAKVEISKYQPISYRLTVLKKEDISNGYLETFNKAHTLSKAQVKQLRHVISKVIDERLQRGEEIDWKIATDKYRFSDRFLEKYRDKMGEEIYNEFLEKSK